MVLVESQNENANEGFLQWQGNLYLTNPSAENNYKSWIKAQNKAKSWCLKVLESNQGDQKSGTKIQYRKNIYHKP